MRRRRSHLRSCLPTGRGTATTYGKLQALRCCQSVARSQPPLHTLDTAAALCSTANVFDEQTPNSMFCSSVMKLRPVLTSSDSFQTLALSSLHPTARHLGSIEVVGLTYKWREKYSLATGMHGPAMDNQRPFQSPCVSRNPRMCADVKQDDGVLLKSPRTSKAHSRLEWL
jgi:hypothetical protein